MFHLSLQSHIAVDKLHGKEIERNFLKQSLAFFYEWKPTIYVSIEWVVFTNIR